MRTPSPCVALVNAGIPRMSLDAPGMAPFLAEFGRIYAAAEAAPGYVWHLPQEVHGASRQPLYLDPAQFEALGAGGRSLLVNLSLWRDPSSARAFVYRSAHGGVMRENRGRWFDPLPRGPLALWWTVTDERPTVAEGLQRLLHLHRHGPTAEAFDFVHPFPPPDTADSADRTGAAAT